MPWHGRNSRDIGARLTTSGITPARSLGRQAREFLARAPLARRYRRPGPGELLLARVEQLGLLKGILILGCMGFGAGMMYVLEPRLGRRRRALVRDKAQAYWRRMGKFIGQTARDARQRTYGLIAETQAQIRGTNCTRGCSLGGTGAGTDWARGLPGGSR